MYVTLEPCQMCSGALVQSRIDEVVIGCMNAKAGCAGSVMNLLQVDGFNHQVKITQGVLEEECSSMLSEFSESFVRKRSRKRQPLKLHRKIRRENRNNKSKDRQNRKNLKGNKSNKITEVMLQVEIKRGE